MNTERKTHLINLFRHSCDIKLITPNSVLNPQSRGNEGFEQIKKEMIEALDYLKQENRLEITLTPYDEYRTIIHLKPKKEVK